MTTLLLEQLQRQIAKQQASVDELARILGLTPEELDEDTTRPDPRLDSYDDDVTCYRCGAANKTLVGGATWRWNGEHWEHRCAGLGVE